MREQVAVLVHPDLDLVAEDPEPTSQDDRSVEFKQFRVQTAPDIRGAVFFAIRFFAILGCSALSVLAPGIAASTH